MHIFVQFFHSQIKLECDPDDTILTVKRKLKPETGMRPCAGTLYTEFDDDPLEPDQTLSSYDIESGQTLTLKLEQQGAALARVQPTKGGLNIYSEDYSSFIFVSTFHRSCSSLKYHPEKRFAGLIMYGVDGEPNVFYLGSNKCRPGYVVFVDTEGLLDEFPNEVGVVHGAAFRKIFGIAAPKGVIGEGFSVQSGQLKVNSYSFNTGTPHHDDRKEMNEWTHAALTCFVEEWKKGNSAQNYPLPDLLKEKVASMLCVACGVSHIDI